jgi:hypothetical protein
MEYITGKPGQVIGLATLKTWPQSRYFYIYYAL